MKKLFESFEKPSLKQWKELIQKELKAKNSDDPIQFDLSLEDLIFTEAYENVSTLKCATNPSTNWEVGVEILVEDYKEANLKALQALDLGADTLTFNLTNQEEIDFLLILDKIEYQYINLYFITKNSIQKQEVLEWFNGKKVLQLYVYENHKTAFDLHEIGANASQEIAWNLSFGLNELNKEESNIQFTFGIGSNFLLEISKFRAFHILWDKIRSQYEKKIDTKVLAKTSFLNKSLSDPYTNILRQTTEALSAALGGVNQIIIQPFDALSEQGQSTFAERIALNISHILKEEALIHQFSDPLSGSFVVEKYTELLCDKSWNIFQKIENLGGSNSTNAIHYISEEIVTIQNKRIENIQSNKEVLVGITKFPNPEKTHGTWKKDVGENFGIEKLILEKWVTL